MFPEYSFKKYQFYCYTLYVVCYRSTMYKVNTPMMNPTKYYLVNCCFHSIIQNIITVLLHSTAVTSNNGTVCYACSGQLAQDECHVVSFCEHFEVMSYFCID
jgi:superfamily II helicase